ncbi:hypothetical protein MRX96_036501 [Rhipicephalus microplus]
MLFASRDGPAANQTAIDAAGSSLVSRSSHGAAGCRWKPGVQRFRDDSLVSSTDGWPELRRHLASVFRRDAERSAAAQRAPSAHAPRGCNPCGAATAGIATHERRQARAPRPPPPRYVPVQTSRAATGIARHGRRCVYARHAVFRNHAVADPSYSSNGHRSPNYERPAPADLPRTNLASHSPLSLRTEARSGTHVNTWSESRPCKACTAAEPRERRSRRLLKTLRTEHRFREKSTFQEQPRRRGR